MNLIKFVKDEWYPFPCEVKDDAIYIPSDAVSLTMSDKEYRAYVKAIKVIGTIIKRLEEEQGW